MSIKDRCISSPYSSNRLFNISAGARFGAASLSISLLVVKAMHFPSHAVSGACLMAVGLGVVLMRYIMYFHSNKLNFFDKSRAVDENK